MRAFRDGVLRGVKKMFNQDPLVLQADDLLAGFPVSEDGKFALVNRCESFLAAFRQCPEPSGELRFRVARILARLRRPAEALAVLDAIPADAGVGADDVTLYRAELSYLAGDIEAAERHFAGLDRLQLQTRPSWKRSLERFEKHKRELHGKRRALDLYASLADPAGPDLGPLRALLAQDNLPLAERDHHAFIHDRVAHLAALAVQEAVPRAAPQVHPVFACGFGWSGSGAVSAFLSQSAEVCMPFGHSEMAHLQGRNRVRGIKPFLKPKTLTEPAMRALLVEFVCRSVGTFGDSKDGYSLFPYYRDAAARAALGAAVDGFCAEMLTTRCLQDRAARGTALADFVLRAIAILSTAPRPVLNNVFMAGNVLLARYMPSATFVIVKRDLRDQYVARKLEGKAAYERPVAEFAEMIQRAWGKYIRNAKAGDAWLSNIVELQFEEFVQEPAYRRRLLDVLGIAAGSMTVDPSKFDPEVSGKNAGIHASYARHEELALLADLATHFDYSKKGVVTL